MKFLSDIPNYLSDTKMVNLRISYFSGGIINMYQDYFNGKLDCTLNDISLEVAKQYQLKLKNYLEIKKTHTFYVSIVYKFINPYHKIHKH